jgi:hypothetical protein
MTITRRALHTMLISAISVEAIGLSDGILGGPAIAAPVYRYRLRYFRKNRRLLFWIRLLKPDSLNEDIPFTLVLATDPNATNEIYSVSNVSSPDYMNISRAEYTFKKGAFPPGTPVYCTLLLGTERAIGRVWALKS